MSTTKTQTIKKLKALGWHGKDVERYLRGRRYDFNGIGDVMAWHEELCGCWLLQTTTASNISSHKRKIEILDDKLFEWLGCERHFELWGWRGKGREMTLQVWSPRWCKAQERLLWIPRSDIAT